MKLYQVVVALLLGGCTTLGAMPGMTMARAVPEPRAGVEAQFAGTPGFHLSDATQENEHGQPLGQLSGWLDLGEKVKAIDGLGVGFRAVEHGIYEPMLRYRRWLDDDHRFALGLVGFGTYAKDAEKGADVAYVHAGAEVSTDIRLTPENRWAEAHLQAGATVNALSANGHYCSDPITGLGIDCNETTKTIESAIQGAYVTGSVGVSLDLFRGIPVLHSVRVGSVFAGGNMPQLRSGKLVEDRGWYSFGFDVQVGLGDW